MPPFPPSWLHTHLLPSCSVPQVRLPVESGQDGLSTLRATNSHTLSSTVSAPCNKKWGSGSEASEGDLYPLARLVLVCMELSSTDITIRKQTPTQHPSCPPPQGNLIHLQLPLDPILLTCWFLAMIPLLSPFRSEQTQHWLRGSVDLP